jgi:hypothetical protein
MRTGWEIDCFARSRNRLESRSFCEKIGTGWKIDCFEKNWNRPARYCYCVAFSIRMIFVLTDNGSRSYCY